VEEDQERRLLASLALLERTRSRELERIRELGAHVRAVIARE
jgi:hypothetical protein